MPSLLCCHFQNLFVPVSVLPLLPHWPRSPCTSTTACLFFRCHVDLTAGLWVCRHWGGMGWGWGNSKKLAIKIRKILSSLQRTPHQKCLCSHTSSQKKIKKRTKFVSSLKTLAICPARREALLPCALAILAVSSLPISGAQKGLWSPPRFPHRYPRPQAQFLKVECKLSWPLS